MRTWNAIIIGFALGAGAFSGGWLAQEQWKGMLTAQPATRSLTDEQAVLGLTQFQRCSVLVESLPEELRGDVSRATIERWVTNRLENAGLEVISYEDREEAFRASDMSHDRAMLSAQDKFSSKVYVNVGGLRTPDGTTSLTVSLEVNRGAFVWPGYFKRATVYNRGSFILFGRSFDTEAKVRDEINKLMDVFEKDWKACNPK